MFCRLFAFVDAVQSSPKSRIDRADFTDEREIETCEFEEFDFRR
jgi:hypothetical protein